MRPSNFQSTHRRFVRLAAGLWLLLGWAWPAEPCSAQYLRIRDICRVKGQEENNLHGVGLVVGLKGTGGGDPRAIQMLAQYMANTGQSQGQAGNGTLNTDDLKDAKNVALVFVTATIPAAGARQGELLDCVVNSGNAKSLEGGYLLQTSLVGPRPGERRIYATAQGPLALDSPNTPTSAKVHDGCRLEEEFYNAFIKDDKITLVLDKNHASFQTAFEIEDLLNTPSSLGLGNSPSSASGTNSELSRFGTEPIAQAIDQVNIEVRIRDIYRNNPVEFIAHVLDTQIVPPRHDARVVIDERTGSIVIGDNVLVGRVAVAHRNLSIETGSGPAAGPFFEIDQTDTSTTRLKALVAALNSLKVSSDDIIDIIKTLERSGDLYGRLIVQ